MKSDSQLMNELAHRTNYLHETTPAESLLVKECLLDMYKDLQNLCDKHGLRLMLGGGSCLGAIRHKGFIPWDDDLDAMMPRRDYEQLIQLLKNGELGDKYTFSTPSPDEESVTSFMKIYLKDSEYIDLFSINTPFPKGLYIDIFAIDAAPSNACSRLFKGLISNGLEFIAILVLYAKYPNNELREYMMQDPQLWRRYRIKRILGKIFGIIPRRKWLWWFDRFACSDKDTKYWTIPTGRKYYNGEVMPMDTFVPIVDGEFEGMTIHLPGDYDAYLKNLYGNYMAIPPVEKRERHFIHKLRLPSK